MKALEQKMNKERIKRDNIDVRYILRIEMKI